MSAEGLKTTFTTYVGHVYDEDKEGVGTLRLNNGKWYKWLKNTGGANVPVAAACGYKGTNGYVLGEVSIDTTTAANRIIPAGIAMALIPDGHYGWFQIKGFAGITSQRLNANVADGEALKLDATVDGELANATAVTDSICALCIDESEGRIVCDFPW